MYKLGPRTTHIPLDLQDRGACEEALSPLTDVTHIVYSALYETPTSEGGILGGWGRNKEAKEKHNRLNLKMLQNTLEPVMGGASANSLMHVSVVHGTRAYDMYTFIEHDRYPGTWLC